MAINTQARDPWHFPRTDFAKKVVGMAALVLAQRLYSPRRTGKTQFVRHDLIPEAVACGYHPVYIDLWRNTDDSAQALANGFLRAYEELTLANSPAGRTLSQQVRGFRAMGFGVELGDVDRPTPPQDSLSQIGFWLDAAVAASHKPLFVILDEAQQLAMTRNAFAVSAALRSALQAHGHGIAQFFTGSSQDHLARMFADAKAPFYQYGQQLELPTLDRDFVEHIADEFEHTATQLGLDRDALMDAFDQLDRKPGPFREMTTAMLFARNTDIAAFLEVQQHSERERALKVLEDKALKPIEFGVAARVAHGLSTTGRSARRYYATLVQHSADEIPVAQAQRALQRLRDAGLIYRTETAGDYRMTGSAHADTIRERIPLAAAGKE